MAVAANADIWANARVGIFFPGQPDYLTGQCVSLVKWFLGEMCGVSDWQAARGDAMNFGDNLVAQGLATVVSSPQRGDIVVWKQDGGGYGHIGVMCSGGNVFEENVGLAGTPSAIYGGNKVYASRIDPLVASFRKGGATYYRVKTYVENVAVKPQGDIDMIPDQDNYYWRYGKKTALAIRGRELSRAEFSKYIAGNTGTKALEILEDDPEAVRASNWQTVGKTAVNDKWQQQIYDLQGALKATNDKLVAASSQVSGNADLQKKVAELSAQNKALLDNQAAAQATGNSFIQWIGQLFNSVKK